MRTLTFNRIIGVGAMGTVYLGELRGSRGFTRTCAVKVMNRANPDQEQFRARMRDEARLLGMLQDEQILGVSELVEVGGLDCLVMDYVEGVDLGEVVKEPDPKAQREDAGRRARVPAKALAELGAELAGTLHRAHGAVHPTTGEPLHVIHRDVKPANVMVTTRGGVRLLDFGVARAAFQSRESNTQGLVLGTLNYFPPEIMAGAEPTPAVDLYGLGLLLWECGSGSDWGTPQVHRHRFERRVEQRLAELAPEYEPLVGTLRRLLAWRPPDRPTGTQAEKMLLSAAELCSGAGLRSWTRMVVPPLLEKRLASSATDALVGQTLDIKAGVLPTVPPPAPGDEQPQAAPKLHAIDPALIAQAEARSRASQTFNDLAPPAAVVRPAPMREPSAEAQTEAQTEPYKAKRAEPVLDTAALPELPLDPATDEEPRPSELPTTRLQRRSKADTPPPAPRRAAVSAGGRLGPTVLWLSFSALLGIVVGGALLVVIVVAAWIALG